MAIVAVYKFLAKFRSTVDAPGAAPRLYREGLLLLRQDTEERDDAAAIAACASYEAFDAVIQRYTPMDPTALERPQNSDFIPLHAKALGEGSALVFYEHPAPDGNAG
jgi:phytoene/squalene synthetase